MAGNPGNFLLIAAGAALGWIALLMGDADPLPLPLGIISLGVASEALDRFTAYRLAKLRDGDESRP